MESPPIQTAENPAVVILHGIEKEILSVCTIDKRYFSWYTEASKLSLQIMVMQRICNRRETSRAQERGKQK